jgi:hypothetical protein
MRCRRMRKFLPVCTLALLTIGCTYSRTYWGDWKQLAGWHQTGRTETQTISITSMPPEASVYVEGTLHGQTPITVTLTYPVLESEWTRDHYEYRVPGVLEHFLLFQQTNTSIISFENEKRFSKGRKTYLVQIEKEGYITTNHQISVPERRLLEVVLEEMPPEEVGQVEEKDHPVFGIKGFKIKNSFRLTSAEKVYEILYGRRFSTDTSRLQEIIKRSAEEALCSPSDRTPDYYLEGEINIQRSITEVTVTVRDKAEEIVTVRKTTAPTKNLKQIDSAVKQLIKSVVGCVD